MTKKTQGEHAEAQTNAFVEEGIRNVPKPPIGIGPEWCTECDEHIEMDRREACGNGLCHGCATTLELKAKLNA